MGLFNSSKTTGQDRCVCVCVSSTLAVTLSWWRGLHVPVNHRAIYVIWSLVYTPGRVTLGDKQVCDEDLDKTWPNHLRAGEKWISVQGITFSGATPSTSSHCMQPSHTIDIYSFQTSLHGLNSISSSDPTEIHSE